MSVTPSTVANDLQVRRWPWARRLSVRSLFLGLTLAVVTYLVLVPLFMLLYASVKSTEDKLPFESTIEPMACSTSPVGQSRSALV